MTILKGKYSIGHSYFNISLDYQYYSMIIINIIPIIVKWDIITLVNLQRSSFQPWMDNKIN